MKTKHNQIQQLRIVLRCGVGIAIATATADARAQTAAASAADTSESFEIVVTAQKREERLQDVPISISVLSGSTLDQTPVRGVSDALALVPGISFSESTHAGGGLVSVRGVSAPQAVFGGSSPVGYYLDSVPFGLVQSAIAPDADVYDLDRVEALRGPQGTLYGASALAGVVRVLTKDPDLDDFELKFRVAGSTTQAGGTNYRGDVAANVPIIDGKLAVRAVVGYQNLDGWIDTPLKKNANDTEAQNYRFKISAQPTDDLSIIASAWLSRDNSGGVSAGGTYKTRNVLVDEPHSSDFDAYGLRVNYDFHSFNLTSNTSYLSYKGSGVTDGIYPFGVHLPIEFGFNSKIFSEEVLLASEGKGPWRWTAGAFYRDARDHDLAAVPNILHLDWTNISKSYAIFGEITRVFADGKFDLTLGGRYFHDKVTSLEDQDVAPINPPDYYRDQDTYSATTPRVVLTWHPSRTLSGYASYSQGFRSGTKQAYYTVGGQKGFPGVKPDRLYNYEIGLKSDTRALSFDIALYYMKWKDIQQEITVAVGNPPVQVAAILNGESASGVGVDVGLTMRPVDGLEFGGTLSWNNLESDADVFSEGALLFAKGDRLNYSPKYDVGLFANYTAELGGGYKSEFSVSGNYTDKKCSRYIIAGAQAIGCGKAVYTSRASVGVESPQGWRVTLYGDNLNNFKGAVVGDPYWGPEFTRRIRPRTIGLQFDYRL